MEQGARATPNETYGRDYFDWQKRAGEFAAVLDRFKFESDVGPGDRVVDFGCGGGYMLAALHCLERRGVEINPHARRSCAELGVHAVPSLDDVEDGWADVVISHHALEHVPEPFAVLMEVRRVLKPDGKAVFVVPCESWRRTDDPGNVDGHLYTWSPLNAGNLFRAAGFEDVSSVRVVHRWVPKPYLMRKLFGWKAVDTLSWIHGWLRPDLTQVKVVARSPGAPAR